MYIYIPVPQELTTPLPDCYRETRTNGQLVEAYLECMVSLERANLDRKTIRELEPPE